MRRFLEAILPSEGYYVGCWKPANTGIRQKSFTTIDELVSHLSRMDGVGFDTYHACSSFKTAENRKHENVQAVKSLWLDVDVGEGKAYPNASEAASNVVSFCRVVGLPIPTMVGSGYGLHCYWICADSLTRNDWLPYAQGLKALCQEKGLDIDPSRTADASSILRTPGTCNYKAEPRKVQWDGRFVKHSWDDFAKLVRVNRSAFNLHVGKVHKGSTTYPSLIQAALGGTSYAESYTDRVAEGCAQIREFKETRGNIPEPQWYKCLGVVVYCVDGREKAHAYSQGHPNYTYEETERKLDQVSHATTGATTCSGFQSTSPALCMGCPKRGIIKSPIVLGYEHEYVASSTSNTTVLPNGRADIVQLVNGHAIDFPTLLAPFAWNDDHSLVIQSENKRGTKVEQVISKFPIYLKGINRDEASGDDYHVNYIFAHLLPQEGWKQFSVPAATFVGAQGLQEFAKHGANISDWGMFKKAVGMMVDDHNYSSQMGIQYQQFGWKDQAFLIGDRIYTPGSIDRVTVSDALLRRARHLRPTAGGSPAKWSAAAARLFAPGLEVHSLAIAAAAGAPLMRFFAEDEGGAIIHMATEDSGTGKTTSLQVAMSFWGQLDGLRLTSEDTKISKGLILGTLKHLPVAWDELTARDPEAMAEFIRMFTEGRDRNRATSSGDLKESYLNWQTIMLSAANRSVVEMLSTVPKDAAMGWRVMEFNSQIPAEVISGKEIDEIKNTLVSNCGHAGDRFLRYLVDPTVIEYVKWALKERHREIVGKYGFEAKHRFWARALSCVWVAGELCNKLELLEFNPERIVDWAARHLMEFKTVEVSAVRAIRLLVDYLDTYYEQTLVVNNSRSDLISVEPKRGRLIIRRETDSQTIYIASDYFDTWLVRKGHSIKETVRELVRLGIMEEKHTFTVLGKGTEWMTGKIQCWKVRADVPAFVGEEQARIAEVNTGKVLRIPIQKLMKKRTKGLPT